MKTVKFGDILDAEDEATRAQRVKRGFWKTFRRAARHIPFSQDVAAAYFCAFDPSTPTRVRAMLMAALAYFVLPFDAIPDFIVGIGFADDAAVLMTAINMLRSHLKPVHYEAAKQMLADDDDA